MPKKAKMPSRKPARRAESAKHKRPQRETAAAMSSERVADVRRRKTIELHAEMDPKTGRPRR